MKTLIDEATRFAAMKHDGQYRKGTNIPYITHPFGVALLLMEEKQSENLIAAGLLHDTLEDTETTEEEIFKCFGEEILMLIKSASEPDKTLAWELRKQHTIDSIAFRSIDELYLILADKLHNLRCVQVDVNRQGNHVWSRFNRGKREQCWYYMSIACALNKRKKEIPLIKKFEEEVCELFIGKKRLSVSDMCLLFECMYLENEQVQKDLLETGLDNFAREVHEAAGSYSTAEDKSMIDSIKKLLIQEGLNIEKQNVDAYFTYAFLLELKYQLGWNEELFLHNLKLYY